MIRKIAVAMVAASCLYSFSARAGNTEQDIAQACFKLLSDAQLQVWSTIAKGTLKQCQLDAALDNGKLSYSSYSSQSEANYFNVYNLLNTIQDKMNEDLYNMGCETFELDWWGFGEGFEFTDLCFYGEGET